MLKPLPCQLTSDLRRVRTSAFFSPAQRSWHLRYFPRLGGLFEGLGFGLNRLSCPSALATVSATLRAQG